MSVLLEEIIADLKAKRIEYEEYLKRIADLATHVQTGQADDTPTQLNTPGLRALYNNLKPFVREDAPLYDASRDTVLELSLRIDETVKKNRPDGWRGVQAREQIIKHALYDVLQDVAEAERIFLIIEQQKEY